MTFLASFLMLPCLAVSSRSDQVTAGDLAPVFHGLETVAPETPLAFAPAPGVARVFRVPELHRMAARWSVPPPDAEICVERPVTPLDPEKLLSAMRKTLPEGTIEILDFSRRPAPEGEIEFPAAGLTNSPSGSLWTGYVNYGQGHKFAIWARVKARLDVTCLVASRDLLPGQAIVPEAVAVETREQPPAAAACVRSIDGVAGKWPRLWIRAGSAILATQLENSKEVARGDTVVVAVQEGGAHLEAEARAEASGAAGEVIPVRNLSSQKRFMARVTGKGRASVILSSGEGNR